MNGHGGPMSHILIIEDEEVVLRSLKQIFTDLGYRVAVARDGGEAIEILKQSHDLTLVITDINMPRVTGNAVARFIRTSEKADMPILAITGYTDMIEGDSFDSVFVKPFEIKELINTVKSYTINTSL
jgi:CheY-like chemotaxis protein